MPKKTEPTARPGEKLYKIGDMTVGIVPRDRIRFRRDNYRKMSALQRDTLKASVDRFGFQSFVVVRLEDDGMYGLVDGHHRLEELDERGVKEIPILILPEVSATDADLGMLSFNVSADRLRAVACGSSARSFRLAISGTGGTSRYLAPASSNARFAKSLRCMATRMRVASFLAAAASAG